MVRSTSRGRRSRWAVWLSTLAIVVGAGLFPTASALAGQSHDMVLEWNQHTLDALTGPPTATPPGAGQPPQVAVLNVAMVQGAVYDAVNAIDRRHEPYLRHLPKAPRWASKNAAAATAAHHVLVGIVPALPGPVIDSLNGFYAASMDAIKDGRHKKAEDQDRCRGRGGDAQEARE